MVDPNHIANVFNRNHRVAKRQIEGLSDADCLIQPAVRGNCINWILGHMLLSRGNVLESLGQKAVIDSSKLELYDTDSEPITEESVGILKLEELVNLFDESQTLIDETLSAISDADWLEKEIDERGNKQWERIEFLSWHENYHVGQLEYLRQLAGTDDKVI